MYLNNAKSYNDVNYFNNVDAVANDISNNDDHSEASYFKDINNPQTAHLPSMGSINNLPKNLTTSGILSINSTLPNLIRDYSAPNISNLSSSPPSKRSPIGSTIKCLIQHCNGTFQQTNTNERHRAFRSHFNGHPSINRRDHINNTNSLAIFSDTGSGICMLCANYLQ